MAKKWSLSWRRKKAVKNQVPHPAGFVSPLTSDAHGPLRLCQQVSQCVFWLQERVHTSAESTNRHEHMTAKAGGRTATWTTVPR